MADVTWEPPRCEHGNIILGCPHDDCVEQTIYVMEQMAAVGRWEDWQRKVARRIVREMFGLKP